MLTTILFDLDGTLLPLEEKSFLDLYFGLLAKYFSPFGLEQKALTKAIWKGTEAMYINTGSQTNEQVFWDAFESIIDFNAIPRREFERFYEEEFDQVKASSWVNPLSRKTLDLLKEKGYQVALATNPIFPAIATKKRIGWAGLRVDDFLVVTTFENSHGTKPSKAYYQEVLNQIGKSPSECLMVGNDATEDIAAEKAGIPVYLITDCLINEHNVNLSQQRKGTFEDFFQFVQSLPSLR
jgi:HAD superfamily hydrolase (TIGR01549 family)